MTSCVSEWVCVYGSFLWNSSLSDSLVRALRCSWGDAAAVSPSDRQWSSNSSLSCCCCCCCCWWWWWWWWCWMSCRSAAKVRTCIVVNTAQSAALLRVLFHIIHNIALSVPSFRRKLAGHLSCFKVSNLSSFPCIWPVSSLRTDFTDTRTSLRLFSPFQLFF